MIWGAGPKSGPLHSRAREQALREELERAEPLSRFERFSVIQTQERSARDTPRYTVYGHYADGTMVQIDKVFIHDEALAEAERRAFEAGYDRGWNDRVHGVAYARSLATSAYQQSRPSCEK